MGSGASMEDNEPTPTGQPPVVKRPVSRREMDGNWRQALKTTSLSQKNMRKMKAAVLGRKSACSVQIDKSGFSLQHIQICEGQVVTFMWNEEDSKGHNVTQVVHDGDSFKPVIGGFCSGETKQKGYFEQQFNLSGEYKFLSSTLRTTPLTIEVYPRKAIECEITDDGFSPSLLRMDEGSSVHWHWSATSVPHTITEVKYNHKTGMLVRKETDTRPMPSKSSDCMKEFPKPGVYYFQTESIHSGEMNTCMVHVRERQREFKFEILDTAYDPPIHVIQEGDRVWWQWDQALCDKPHRVYQIEAPPLDHPSDASYKPMKGGFSWPAPTRSGLLSREFFEPGVYHFCDHNRQESAEYIGTIIVKPKQMEHYVELTREGFTPDLVYANTGDRIWWTWLKEEVDHLFNIKELEKCISPIGGRATIENEAIGEGNLIDEETQYIKNTAGLESAQMGGIGVYHYKVNEGIDNLSTCSVIVKGGSKNVTIHVTDSGFEPKVVTVNPGDRVWWIWQNGKKAHNITQMSHQGKRIAGGFCSGAPIDCPSAFMHQFSNAGVFYYVSDSLLKAFGAVVVASQPKVHEIQVSANNIVPDPLPVNVNDVVVWTFRGLRQNDLARIETVDQILDAQQNCMVVSPRRCLNQLFTERGVYHYVSKSFVTKSKKERTAMEDTRISSVLVDELSDSSVMRVDGRGFHPEEVTIKKDQSILWSWKDSEQAHNIVHVNAPSSEAPLSVIQGGQSFNSGTPTPRNSFLYTFDEPGTYCVASQGAPGFSGTVHVLVDARKAEMPEIVSETNGGTVDKHHVVKLKIDSKDALMYYTLDGFTPDLHKFGLKKYDHSKGIVMKDSGLRFVRAMAVADGILNSDVFSSKRFWVLSDGAPPRTPSPEPQIEPVPDEQWKWWKCVPEIKAYFIQPGILQVFWDLPHPEFRRLLKGYQLFLNDISYCEMFPPTYNSVTVSGLAGDALYEVVLEAYPNDQMYLPHKSNKLVMKNQKTTSTSGPIISLEVTEKPDSIAIVWMSISTESDPISGYRVYLNGRMCGSEVAPDAESNRCKVVIEKCQLDQANMVQVAALPPGGASPKMSNELEVHLPLDVACIRLPPRDARMDNDDVYNEYLEVRPGEANIVDPTDDFPTIPEDPNEVETLDLTGPEYQEYEGTQEIVEPPYGAPPEGEYAEEGYEVVTYGYEDGVNYMTEELKQMKAAYKKKKMENQAEENDESETEIGKQKSAAGKDESGKDDQQETNGRDNAGKSVIVIPKGHTVEDKDKMAKEGENGNIREENAESEAPGGTAKSQPESGIETGTTGIETEAQEAERQRDAEEEYDEEGEEASPRDSIERGSVDSGGRHHSSEQYENYDNTEGEYIEDYGASPEPGYDSGFSVDHGQYSQTPTKEQLMLLDAFQKLQAENQALAQQNQRMHLELEGRGEGYQQEDYDYDQSARSQHSKPPSAPRKQSIVSVKSSKSSGKSRKTSSQPRSACSSRGSSSRASSSASVRSQSLIYQRPPSSPVCQMAPRGTAKGAILPMGVKQSKHKYVDASSARPCTPYSRQTVTFNTDQPTQHSSPYPHQVAPHPPLPAQQVEVRYLQDYDYSRPPQYINSGQLPYMDGSYSEHKKGVSLPYLEEGASPRVEVVAHADSEHDGYGIIDATRGHWKLKTVGDGMRAAKRINLGVAGLRGMEMVSRPRAMAVPGGHYEVEVEDDLTSRRSSLSSGRKKPARVEMTEEVTLSMAPPDTNGKPLVPILGRVDASDLPVPMVTAQDIGPGSALIKWTFPRSPDPQYRLLLNTVNVVGTKFDQRVNSNISFECMMDQGGNAVPAIQQVWNVTNGNYCEIQGLFAGGVYDIHVVANYSMTSSQQPCEIQAKSQVITYKSVGPPVAPVLRVVSTDLGQVTLNWHESESSDNVKVTGYKVLVDGKQMGTDLSVSTKQTTIDNLRPGQSISVSVVALTSQSVGESQESNVIRITCPSKARAPFINQQPSYKKGCVIVAWSGPDSADHVAAGEDICFYRIYLDGKYHGEVNSSSHGNKHGYQYCLTDLSFGQSYDISIKAYAGQRKVDPSTGTVYCLAESESSNTIPVMCPAPPNSPHLRLEGMHSDGIDVNWEMPQQFGDAAVSGFQMMKDSKLYGSIIPLDVHNLRIKGLTLGDTIELQILALTDHPVGRHEAKGGESTEGDSGFGASNTDDRGFSEIYIGDRYSACKPGPKLRICYTGLVQPPSKVWCEQVSGHSAMIVWNKAERPQPHYVAADSYQVTWWPGDRPEQEINSQSTTDDHLLITGLRPRVNYNVVVEARKMQTYSAMQEYSGSVPEDGVHNTFILTAKSDHLTVKTARPPEPPSNLGVVATTCTSIQVSWDTQQERGTEIIGMRIDAVPMKTRDPHNKHSATLVVPNSVSAVVDGLMEKTEYLVTVTAITEEYFEQLPDGHELKLTKSLPMDRVPKDDPWLPSSSVIASTSGTNPPSDVKIVKTTPDSVTISWIPPVVFGSNRLQGTVVRWAEGKFRQGEESNMAHHRSVTAESNEVTIDSLFPGILYKIVVEAVVSVKNTLEGGRNDPQMEKQNRRTTHVMSQPVFFRTRAPCEPPEPIIVAYTLNTIQLYWEKPIMYTVVGRDEEDNPRYLKLSLEGYRLEINGKPHMRLVPSAQSCTLVKCKPGKTYSIVLVALSCTEDVKRDRKRKGRSGTMDMTMNTTLNGTMTLSGSLNASMLTTNKEWQVTTEDYENDESFSPPLEITLPRQQDGLLCELSASYMLPAGADEASPDSADIGDIQVDWAMQGDTTNITQFTTMSTCLADHCVKKKVQDAHARSCVLPIQDKRCLYEIALQPHFSKEVSSAEAPKVYVPVPGAPDAPVIFLRSVSPNEFVIEWAEPKLYCIKVDGYQVYMNGKKVGNVLSKHHRKAIMACKPNKQYKVQLVALTKERLFGDSPMSNILYVNTSPDGTRPLVNDYAEEYPEEDDDMMVRIVKVSDSSVQLEWSRYDEPEGMAYYRVVWSSAAQPTEKEVKLPAGEKSCVIHKCYAGSNHFIRIYAMGTEERLLDKSRQITVQTSAAPDTPLLTLRACNFRYIAIQWEKPSTYGHTPVSGYKVFVNGVVEAQLGPDQYTYSLTSGKWCREYVFQVQAITGVDRLQSKPSEPLVVMWPGVQAPNLRRVPAISSNAIKVVWDPPMMTEGVKIKQYKVICLDELTERPVQVISPIHPETTEAEIHSLKQGTYLIYCEVHLHGTDDVVKTDVLRVQPQITPDPPQITVTVIGLEERRQIEKITCDLINKRDRLLNVLAQRDGRVSPRFEDEVGKAANELAHVESLLEDCLASMQHYTGHLLAHISWTCRQSNPDLKVTGFKAMVDGKQYGTTMHSGVKNIRIKLGLGQPSHRLSMVSVCDRPHAVSAESNVVELLTEPFQPFSFFNYLFQEPRRGGVVPSYHDCFPLEKTRPPINQGLLKKQVAPPACTMMDLYAGEYHPLFPPSGPKRPTAILFWADWSPMSKKMLGWFVRFARTNSSQYDFVSVACAKSSEVTAADKQRLVQTLTDNGWREDSCIRHVTGYSLATSSTIVKESEHDCPFSKHRHREEVVLDNQDSEHLFIHLRGADHSHSAALTDMCEMFGVKGVPTIVIVHPQDYVAWKGRYCPFDYALFENFMLYVMSQVMGNIPAGADPWDINIDTDALDGAKKRRMTESQMLVHRTSSTKQTHTMRTTNGTSTTIHLNNSTRPHSAKKFFVRTNKHKSPRQDRRLTVSLRPYSATSPYEERLTSTAPPRRAKSGRRTKSVV